MKTIKVSDEAHIKLMRLKYDSKKLAKSIRFNSLAEIIDWLLHSAESWEIDDL